MQWLYRAAFTLGAGLILASCHQNGLVFVADTTADTVDADPGDGVCADASGSCSLRAAVMEANASAGVDHIVLADGVTYTFTIAGTGEDAAATGDLDLTEAVVISGAATIDAGGIDRVFDVLASVGVVEIDGPDLTGGTNPTGDGAAIEIRGGATTILVNANIHTNASSGFGVIVAVVDGTLYLWSSTVHDNVIDSQVAVGVWLGATLNLQNATIADNTVQFPGSVPCPDTASIGGSGDAWVSFSPLSQGICAAQPGTVTVRASIVSGCDRSLFGNYASQGYNIETATSCGFTAVGDLQATDPLLGPLQDNGGPVLTRAPLATSPAIDRHGPPSCTLFGRDARHLPRPAGPGCDTGAVEIQ